MRSEPTAQTWNSTTQNAPARRFWSLLACRFSFSSSSYYYSYYLYVYAGMGHDAWIDFGITQRLVEGICLALHNPVTTHSMYSCGHDRCRWWIFCSHSSFSSTIFQVAKQKVKINMRDTRDQIICSLGPHIPHSENNTLSCGSQFHYAQYAVIAISRVYFGERTLTSRDAGRSVTSCNLVDVGSDVVIKNALLPLDLRCVQI